jgi:hypothetical protein
MTTKKAMKILKELKKDYTIEEMVELELLPKLGISIEILEKLAHQVLEGSSL